jgi:hypothetical protein
VDFGYQLSICSRTKRNPWKKPWSSCLIAGPCGYWLLASRLASTHET